MTLLMEERAFRRYPDWASLRRLLMASVFENLGYRQFLSLVRARSWLTLGRSRRSWGEMARQGFDELPRVD